VELGSFSETIFAACSGKLSVTGCQVEEGKNRKTMGKQLEALGFV
jgi:hypothetical protein